MDRSELESRISNDTSPVFAARELLRESYNADAEAFQAAMEKAICTEGPGVKTRTVFIDDVTVYTGKASGVSKK